MDPIGLVDSTTDAAIAIDFGRKGFATRGKAEEGLYSPFSGCKNSKFLNKCFIVNLFVFCSE